MLPNAYDHPAALAEKSRYPPVSISIASDFFQPVGRIPAWRTIALWASMPKTAVNEQCYTTGVKNEIWSARYWLVASPTCNLVLAQQSCERKLGGAVLPAANGGHDSRSGGRWLFVPDRSGDRWFTLQRASTRSLE